MSSTVTWDQWAKTVNERLDRLHDYLLRIMKIEDAICLLYVDRERPALLEDLKEWRSWKEIVRSEPYDTWVYYARTTLLQEFRKQRLVEEKHQGRNKPILFRLKGVSE